VTVSPAVSARAPRAPPRPKRVAPTHTDIRLKYDAAQRDAIANLGGKRAIKLGVRIKDLQNLFKHRYGLTRPGLTLPDDDAGREDAEIMAHHLAHKRGDACENITNWLNVWAPWMPASERESMITRVVAKRRRWSAGELGSMLNLTAAERAHLRITSFRVAGMTKKQQNAERRERKRDHDRQSKEQERRDAGKPTREQWLAQSKTHTQPWKACGMGKSAWYKAGRPTA
jgi:hypothetical protein